MTDWDTLEGNYAEAWQATRKFWEHTVLRSHVLSDEDKSAFIESLQHLEDGTVIDPDQDG